MKNAPLRKTTKRSVDISTDFLSWYAEEFEGASVNWVLNMLAQQFMEAYEKRRTPKQVAKLVAGTFINDHVK